jgi:hypothetical protein
MQAAVSICIIGPIADRGGEVEVRRYVSPERGVYARLLMVALPACTSTGLEALKVLLGRHTIPQDIRMRRSLWLRTVERILVSSLTLYVTTYTDRTIS